MSLSIRPFAAITALLLVAACGRRDAESPPAGQTATQVGQPADGTPAGTAERVQLPAAQDTA
ncbi:MAG: hypothetical protein M3418_13115, partial [Gemmatimonadota bacterium]|nr:hypothetical protein [Gemmatimonadota bacterium]